MSSRDSRGGQGGGGQGGGYDGKPRTIGERSISESSSRSVSWESDSGKPAHKKARREESQLQPFPSWAQQGLSQMPLSESYGPQVYERYPQQAQIHQTYGQSKPAQYTQQDYNQKAQSQQPFPATHGSNFSGDRMGQTSAVSKQRHSRVDNISTGIDAQRGQKVAEQPSSLNKYAQNDNEGSTEQPTRQQEDAELLSGPSQPLNSPWTPEEDELLSQMRQEGMGWDAIATKLRGRTGSSCRSRFYRCLSNGSDVVKIIRDLIEGLATAPQTSGPTAPVQTGAGTSGAQTLPGLDELLGEFAPAKRHRTQGPYQEQRMPQQEPMGQNFQSLPLNATYPRYPTAPVGQLAAHESSAIQQASNNTSSTSQVSRGRHSRETYCPVKDCREIFPSPTACEAHLLNDHGGGYNVRCERCGVASTTYAGAHQHETRCSGRG